jgi:hypothetical protein
MGTTNQMLAYMMANPNAASLGAQAAQQSAAMGAQDPNTPNIMPSSSSPMSGMMGLSPQMIQSLMQSGALGANQFSGGYGAGGNGLTQVAPYSQGINPADSAVISNMFASS